MYTETFYWFRRLDDDMRAAMAIDWIAREREKPGKIYRDYPRPPSL
jgi:hypothetical protein